MEDDFVIDNGVGGYVGNGMDNWASSDQDAKESDEEYDKLKKGTFFYAYIGDIDCPL